MVEDEETTAVTIDIGVPAPGAVQSSSFTKRNIECRRESTRLDPEDVKRPNSFYNSALRESFKIASSARPMRESSAPMPRGKSLRFNGFVSLFGFGVLWGLAIWCMVRPTEALTVMVNWKEQCTLLFTWFYVGTKPIFTFFVIFLGIRFRNVRLGGDNEKPDFSNITYFAMLFASGIENALFFYGVSEPLWHRNSNWFANSGFNSQDAIDQFAINQTLLHWGLPGWSQYILVAICAGLACYKFGLPLTYRSCFYALLGEYTWGWIGDLIDGFTIVTTVAGVCTSLGLGIMQIVSGLQRLGAINDSATPDELVRASAVVIWVITAIATVSLVSGLNVGIKYLSQLGFSLGMLLLFLVLVMDKTSYVFNLFVQSTGYYLQYSVILLNFWTDAFGQLQEGEGRAIDGRAGESWWMDAWTVFYWAWWTAWAGFVGLFLARISKGRKIGEVVLYGFVAAILYTFLWFCTFGGVGLRQARQATEMEQLGAIFYGNPDEFLASGSTYCYNVPQHDLIVNGSTIFTNTVPGVTPVCKFNEDEFGAAWYNVMYSFSFPSEKIETGFGPFLSGVTLVAITIYFITSSDSASLVVDHLASNGQEDHHWLQRVFWGLTEGAVCTALMVAGGADALQALQSVAVIAGLPFTLFLCYQAQSTWIMCRNAERAQDKTLKFRTPLAALEDELSFSFDMPVYGGVFNIVEYIISLGRVHEDRIILGMDLPSKFQVVEFVKALFLPFYSFYRVRDQLYPKRRNRNLVSAVLYALFFFAWIGLFIGVVASEGLVAFGWTAFFIDAVLLTNLRMTVRGVFQVKANVVEDFAASSFFYPQALVQMLQEFAISPQPTLEEIAR